MSSSSSIAWTDATWNVVTGCDRVSDGCTHCYIERTMPFRTTRRKFDENGRMGVTLHHDRLRWLLDRPEWREGRRIFTPSLGDLFHKDVPSDFIVEVLAVMAACPQHTFQVLTKRAQRMQALLSSVWLPPRVIGRAVQLAGGGLAPTWPLPNLHGGVSVESQPYADLRIQYLLATTGLAVRIVSYEPALGAVDFENWLLDHPEDEDGAPYPGRLDWVIVGGESGPGARPFDIEWARSTIAQCREADVPVFVKQLGSEPGFKGEPGSFHHYDEPSGLFIKKLDDHKGEDPDEWPDDLRVREFPKTAVVA